MFSFQGKLYNTFFAKVNSHTNTSLVTTPENMLVGFVEGMKVSVRAARGCCVGAARS